MRGILALLPALLFAGHVYASEGSPDNWCRGIEWEGPHFSLAEITGKPGEKIYFQSDKDGEKCPAAYDAACKTKQYLVPGDHVITSRNYKGFVCSGYLSKEGAISGWLLKDNLRDINVSAADAWEGKWVTSYSDILLTYGRQGISAEGSAVWEGNIIDEKTGERNVHSGQFSGANVPRGNYMRVISTEDGSRQDTADTKYDCIVEMWLLRDFLVVKDNNYCGGMNVRFSGIYTRKP